MSIFTINNLARTIKNTSEGLSRFADALADATSSPASPETPASPDPETPKDSDTPTATETEPTIDPASTTPVEPEPIDTMITRHTIDTLADYLYSTSGTVTGADVLMSVSTLPDALRSQLSKTGQSYYSDDGNTLVMPGLDLTMSPDNKAIIASRSLFTGGLAMQYPDAETMMLSPMVTAIILHNVNPDHMPEECHNNVTPEINDLLVSGDNDYDDYDDDDDSDYYTDDEDEYSEEYYG